MLSQLIAVILFLSNVAYLKADERIVNGVSADLSSFPHQALIYPGPYMCGGSILTTNWILTACHCTDGLTETDISFSVGVLDKSKTYPRYTISKLINHPNYTESTFNNDIALIQSKTSIAFNSLVRPIHITPTTPEEGTPVTVSGYGTTKYQGTSSDKLLKADLLVSNFAKCNLAYNNELTSNMICATDVNEKGLIKDSCQGDSGGPLISAGVLVGVVSFGNKCALEGYPGIYTNVANYKSWITQYTGDEVVANATSTTSSPSTTTTTTTPLPDKWYSSFIYFTSS